jgi:hypothetical protein
MKPLNEILGYLDNPEAENLSEEAQLKLVQNIQMLLFNYDNWFRKVLHEGNFTNACFSDKLEAFNTWNNKVYKIK